jgi:subtilisin family serine protease
MLNRAGGLHPSSNLTPGVLRNGLSAPGEEIPGAHVPVGYVTRSGTSFAAGFVTATFALLLGLFRRLGRDVVWSAILERNPARPSLTHPKRLDADAALAYLSIFRGDTRNDS